MDLRQLRYFVAVAQLGSFTAAASRLNIVQSALSRQIANLEIELGVSLFHRDGRRARLSPAGEKLVEGASKILLDVEDLRARVSDEEGEIVGPVALGSHQSEGDVLLPRVFERIYADFPRITLDPLQGMTADLQDMLINGRLDLAILTFPDPLPGLDIDPVAREHVYLVGPADFVPYDRDRCTLPEALSLPLVAAHRPNRERAAMDAAAKRHGMPLRIAIEADNLSLMKLLSRQGRGALMLPETASREEARDPFWRVVRIDGFALTRFLARRSSPAPSRAVAKVNEILLEEIAGLKQVGIMH